MSSLFDIGKSAVQSYRQALAVTGQNIANVNTDGYKRINSINVMKLSKDGGSVVGNKTTYKCDCLGISGGWTPMVHLFTQSGGKLKFRENDQVFIPNTNSSKQLNIRACNGDFTLDEILINTPKSLKEFLNIKETDYENVEILSSSNKLKRNTTQK